MFLNKYIQKNSRTESYRDGDITYVLSPDGKKIFELNFLGSYIWGLLSRKQTIIDISKKVILTFEVTSKTANKDVELYLNKLHKMRLIEISED